MSNCFPYKLYLRSYVNKLKTAYGKTAYGHAISCLIRYANR